MVRVVTQQTYDDVVQENITYFDMTQEEAIDDAVQQFEAQGVDLSNIIKDLILSGKPDNHQVVVSIRNIGNLLKEDTSNKTQLIAEIDRLKSECDKDIAHKLMANKEGAYTTLIDCLKKENSDVQVMISTLKAITSLMNGQPDILDDEGIQLFNRLLDKQTDDTIIIATLKWITVCCLKHERNRQRIFDAQILNHLKNMLETHKNPKILKEVCCVMRHLVLDDDVRVEFGRAHDHARLMATETLHMLTQLVSDFKSDEDFIGDVLLTIATLVVRHELCQKVEAAGGVQFIMDVMVEFHNKEKLNRQCFKLLKALAGHDTVKRNIIKQGAASLICNALETHMKSEPLVAAGLACIAALGLREVENSKALFEAGIPEILLQCMNVHKDSLRVQKNASWAIRNMVTRCLEQRPKYLELGAEDLLNEALNSFNEEGGPDIKSALRDLGCNVKLEEQWTGKGGMIHTSSANQNDDA